VNDDLCSCIFRGKNAVRQEYNVIMYNILLMHGVSNFIGSVESVERTLSKDACFRCLTYALRRQRREVEY
jgi:hypothetical protein